MVSFDRGVLPNGLRVVVNHDSTTPLVSLALMYDVGSKDEEESRTGFAHLFEHLMFGGSAHIPDFDGPLQLAGGVSNAYTSNDVTCFYCTVPSENVETAFWLESDRMLSLAFTPGSLEVQRKVVVEEFKQTHLNQPYGDVSHLLLDLVYRAHPYRWPTIGLRVEHIEEATLEDVRAFFFKHYAPNNAVLAISGNLTFDRAMELSSRWFGPIPRREVAARNLPIEPPQADRRVLEVDRDVPTDALFMAFRMCARNDADYVVWDLLSDLLANGRSGRFPRRLVEGRGLFTSLEASVFGSTDPGLLFVNGMLRDGVSFTEAEDAVWGELRAMMDVPTWEMEKVRNKYEAGTAYDTLSVQSRAQLLAEYELLGGAERLNDRVDLYRGVSAEDVYRVVSSGLVERNSSIIRYHARG